VAKPMKTIEIHYPMIQFLIISDTCTVNVEVANMKSIVYLMTMKSWTLIE